MDPLTNTVVENLAATGGNPLTYWLNHFALTHPWVLLIVPAYLGFLKIITAIRDVIDKTPETDDNWFEKTVTFAKKLGGILLLGQRPTAPEDAKPIPGESKDAIGVKTEIK